MWEIIQTLEEQKTHETHSGHLMRYWVSHDLHCCGRTERHTTKSQLFDCPGCRQVERAWSHMWEIFKRNREKTYTAILAEVAGTKVHHFFEGWVGGLSKTGWPLLAGDGNWNSILSKWLMMSGGLQSSFIHLCLLYDFCNFQWHILLATTTMCFQQTLIQHSHHCISI